MSARPLLMPQLGQAMEFGAVVEWLVTDGSQVVQGQPIANVESDKAIYEIEATHAGVLRHLAAVGAEVPVGEAFATIAESDDASATTSAAGTPGGPSSAEVIPELTRASAVDAMAPLPIADGQELLMPQLGQAMEVGVVAEWLVADGSEVVVGQPVANIESDKSVYEIEATTSGVIRHRAALGEEVPVGKVFATIGDRGGQPAEEATRARSALSAAPSEISVTPLTARTGAGNQSLASPKAREEAKALGVDLHQVAAHRSDGLIVADDVRAVAKSGGASPTTANHESTPLSRLKRTAADRLARSWRQAPHFVQMIEVDATALRRAQALIRQGSLKVTLNDVLIKVAADALARIPQINARFHEDQLVSFPNVSIGLAVATDLGLTVPVVRAADQLTLEEISAETRVLVATAREGRLSSQQLGTASATVSNLGAYGIAFGTPVLNLDEPILIFVGAIVEKPVGRDGEIVLRPMTTLSIAYDHRVVDGLQASLYSSALKQGLESLQGLLPAVESGPTLHERELEARSGGEEIAVRVRSRGHSWTVDEPSDIGGKDTGPDPVSLVLGGLLSCMMIALKLTAKRRKVVLKDVRGTLQATPTGKVKSVVLRLETWSDSPSSDVKKLLAPAKQMCLVHDLLRKDLDLTVELIAHNGSK
jgi:pyruvate dehydrogenase E2 component (dihydrolipoamide acetyltransferase)